MNRMLSPSNGSSNRSCRGLTIRDDAETPGEKQSSGGDEKEEEEEGDGEEEEEEEENAAESGASTKSQEEDVLSGDDFLPIFIYVIVHSGLEAPILTQVLLNRLCDFEKRRSESGYYLATFEAALHHILSLELPDIEAAGL